MKKEQKSFSGSLVGAAYMDMIDTLPTFPTISPQVLIYGSKHYSLHQECLLKCHIMPSGPSLVPHLCLAGSPVAPPSVQLAHCGLEMYVPCRLTYLNMNPQLILGDLCNLMVPGWRK